MTWLMTEVVCGQREAPDSPCWQTELSNFHQTKAKDKNVSIMTLLLASQQSQQLLSSSNTVASRWHLVIVMNFKSLPLFLIPDQTHERRSTCSISREATLRRLQKQKGKDPWRWSHSRRDAADVWGERLCAVESQDGQDGEEACARNGKVTPDLHFSAVSR